MKISPTAFRTLVVASVVLAIATGVVDLAMPELLPDSLKHAQDALMAAPSSTATMIVTGALFLVSAIIGIASIIGLFFFKRWSRTAAIGSSVLALALYPALPAFVYSGWAFMLFTVAEILWGAVLALAYCSNLSEAFESSGTPSPPWWTSATTSSSARTP